MMRSMLTRKCILPLLLVAAMTSAARAQDDEVRPEGRLQGFAKHDGKVGKLEIAEARSGAGTWFMLAGLGALAVGVMFKNGKRTHLD
jgi:hypothetical protein